MEITINLPEAYAVMSRDVACDVKCDSIPVNIWGELALHGLTQKIADAASGAATAAVKEAHGDKASVGDFKDWLNDEGLEAVQKFASAMMDKARDQLVRGDWVRGRGPGVAGVDEATAVARSIMRSAIKAQVGGKSEAWAAFTGLSDAEQAAKLDENFAQNAKALQPAVDAELAARAEKRERKAAIKVKIDI